MVREKFEGSFVKVRAQAPHHGPSRAWAALRAGPLGLSAVRAHVPRWAWLGCWAEWLPPALFHLSIF